MRGLGIFVAVVAIVFAGVMGFYWMRDGSLQAAGAHVDEKLQEMDVKGKINAAGEAVKDGVNGAADKLDKATDDDSRT